LWNAQEQCNIFLDRLLEGDRLVVDLFSFSGGDFDFLVRGLTTTSVEIADFLGGLPRFLGELAGGTGIFFISCFSFSPEAFLGNQTTGGG